VGVLSEGETVKLPQVNSIFRKAKMKRESERMFRRNKTAIETGEPFGNV
jgi:hypothetical protein